MKDKIEEKKPEEKKSYKYWGRKVMMAIIGCIFVLIGLLVVNKMKVNIMFFRAYCYSIIALVTGYGLQNAGISISSFFKNNKNGGKE